MCRLHSLRLAPRCFTMSMFRLQRLQCWKYKMVWFQNLTLNLNCSDFRFFKAWIGSAELHTCSDVECWGLQSLRLAPRNLTTQLKVCWLVRLAPRSLGWSDFKAWGWLRWTQNILTSKLETCSAGQNMFWRTKNVPTSKLEAGSAELKMFWLTENVPTSKLETGSAELGNGLTSKLKTASTGV